MQTKVIRWLILPIGILALAGCQRSSLADCQHSQPVDIALHLVPPSRPFIFYDETGEPPRGTRVLSETEVQEILNWVATQTPDRVWLIRVKLWTGEGKHGSVVAYLVPDDATPRIRAGQAYNVPAPEERTGVRSPWRYAQVSMPDHDFTAELAKPPASEMPFEWPTIWDPNSKEDSAMSKEEVVAIADFARNPSSYRHIPTVPDKGWEEAMARGIFQSPIFKMGRARNKILVSFGYMHGALWGAGVDVRIERTPTGYRVLERHGWVS